MGASAAAAVERQVSNRPVCGFRRPVAGPGGGTPSSAVSRQSKAGTGLHLRQVLPPRRDRPRKASPSAGGWKTAALLATEAACRNYGVTDTWAPRLADCALGVIAVESKFGRSRRYRAKRLLRQVPFDPLGLSRVAPGAQGIAQIDEWRVGNLSREAGLDHDLDAWSWDGALNLVALGLAKAASLLYGNRGEPPNDEQVAITAITHNAGWMVPRVARLQVVLAKLGLLESGLAGNGAAGPATLQALDDASRRFECLAIGDVLLSASLQSPPERGLTDPELYPLVGRSELFRSLRHAASAVGEDLDEPLFPAYRFRRWYTGWISSKGYACAVLAQSEVWRRMSITSLGGSLSSNGR